MADAPLKFALYVSSVDGRTVARPGTAGPGAPHAGIGVSLRSPEEVKAGNAEPVWDTKAVIPITEAEYLRYGREYRALIAGGDLVERSEDEFVAYQKALELVELKREQDAKKAADEAAKKAAEDAKAAEAKAKADAKKAAPTGAQE